MEYMCFFQFWFPQGICLGVGLLGHMVVLSLFFLRNLHTVFQSSCNQLTFSPIVQEGFLSSALSPAFIVCGYFDDGHSDQYEVISHCSFDLHFSKLAKLSIFSCAY